jgi:hypothetical protein
VQAIKTVPTSAEFTMALTLRGQTSKALNLVSNEPLSKEASTDGLQPIDGAGQVWVRDRGQHLDRGFMQTSLEDPNVNGQ